MVDVRGRHLLELVEGYFQLAPFFCSCMVGEGNDMYFGKNSGWGQALCSLFPCRYHLSSLKNCLVFDFLVWDGTSCSFSFGFSHSLFDREVTGVAFLLSLLEGYSFRCGRRDLRVWSPNSLEGSSWKSFFVVCLTFLPHNLFRALKD